MSIYDRTQKQLHPANSIKLVGIIHQSNHMWCINTPDTILYIIILYYHQIFSYLDTLHQDYILPFHFKIRSSVFVAPLDRKSVV